MQFQIIWHDPQDHPDSRIVQVIDGPSIAYARAYADAFPWRSLGEAWEVRAVLPLPTEQEQRDAVLALWTQFHAVAVERWGEARDPDTTRRVARTERLRIQQSVIDDETLGSAVSTAFFVGDHARLAWLRDSTPEEA